jgi:SAM-dependent methyltransferase
MNFQDTHLLNLTTKLTSLKMNSSRDKDANFHDVIAKDYEEYVNLPRKIANNILFNKITAFLPKQKNQMLDLGCGTGQATIRFGANFKNVLLVDHSKEMLQQALINVKNTRVKTNCETLQDNAFHFLEHTNKKFDFIACIGFLHHIAPSERLQLLKLIKNCMHKDARLLIAEPIMPCPDEPKAIAWWNNKYRKNFKVTWTADIEPDEGPIDLNDLNNEFRELNFIIEYQKRAWELLPRFKNSIIDKLCIKLLAFLCRNNGPIYTAVLKMNPVD